MKKNAISVKIPNIQNAKCVPSALSKALKYFVTKKLAIQQHVVAIVEAKDLTLGSKSSPITAHGKGPNPEIQS